MVPYDGLVTLSMPGRRMELGGVRSIKGLDLVPLTPRIGDRSKPRLGHSAGFCLAACDEIPSATPGAGEPLDC